MSTYTNSETAFQTDVAGAYDLSTSEYSALLNGMCSLDVAKLATEALQVPTSGLNSDAIGWERVEQAMPAWRQQLPATSTAALESARTGAIPLGVALSTVALELGTLERLAVADTSVPALVGLGYAVTRVDGIRTSAIEARRGHETLLVVVGDQGTVATDHLGLVGDACDARQSDFVAAMDTRGVLFDESVRVRHDDPRGGSPVDNAVRSGGASLAEGAVRHGDAKVPELRTRLLPAATRATRLAQRGAR
ncbi:hypothetical protein [Pseudolysinimonas yzui]|uniref:Uncharacterized protein n=1 Tax=Pseudolysinimonas yzui TaxID=2708254 RepID=A0A8J3GQ38_9MICO|nr:hypothetical protein [Pseudolysinimonas yzui]GHF14653.1 hypothetical protein GCM10011600_14500 [Pseudolysinimonas yzui]